MLGFCVVELLAERVCRVFPLEGFCWVLFKGLGLRVFFLGGAGLVFTALKPQAAEVGVSFRGRKEGFTQDGLTRLLYCGFGFGLAVLGLGGTDSVYFMDLTIFSPTDLSIYLSICSSFCVRPSVCVSLCLSVCLIYLCLHEPCFQRLQNPLQ